MRIPKWVHNEAMAAWAASISTGASVLIAALALFISIKALQQNQATLDASAQPDITLRWFSEAKSRSVARLSLLNTGPGAGLVKWMRVSIRGDAYQNWETLLRALGIEGNGATTTVRVTASVTVMPVKSFEEVVLVEITSPEPGNEDAIKFIEMSQQKLRFEICYCSIYGRCWDRETGSALGVIDNVQNSCPERPDITLMQGSPERIGH
jgi:hypothetical protein